MNKYKLDKSAQVIENPNYIMTQEEVCERLNDLEAKLAESEHRNEQLVDALNGEVFINYKLPMENAKLKQQLAEKEEQLNNSEQMCLICNKEQENERLKQQLAEKENTIANLTHKVSKEAQNALDNFKRIKELETEVERVRQERTCYYKFGENVKKVTIKTINGKDFDIYNNGYEDKISFAVEQLEKVKEEIDKRPVSIGNCGYGEFDEIILDDVYDVIDNQIASLKKGVE